MTDNLPVPVVYTEHQPRPQKEKPVNKNAGPLTAKDLRTNLMEVAGVTKEELGQILRKAIDTTIEQMDAIQYQTFSYMGKKGDEVFSPDNKTRLKAAEQALRFVDQMPRATKDTGPKTATVVINLPNIYSPEVLKEKPIIIDAEVVDGPSEHT